MAERRGDLERRNMSYSRLSLCFECQQWNWEVIFQSFDLGFAIGILLCLRHVTCVV